MSRRPTGSAVSEAIRLADLWLDEVTDLPSGVRAVESWTRLEWTRAHPAGMVAALRSRSASRVVAAMASALPEGQVAALGPGNPLAAVMNQVGGLMFGAQVGQGLGGLAQEVVAATDIGLPLGPSGVAALVPENVAGVRRGAGASRRRGAPLPRVARGRAPAAVRPRAVAAAAAVRRRRGLTRAVSAWT